MKAWQMPTLGDPWQLLQQVETVIADPPPGRVKIAVEATDLNFADILQCQGTYQVKVDPPFTPGLNSTGIVIAVGDGVEFALGERIVGPAVGCHGGYAAEAVLLAERCQPVPKQLAAVKAMGAHVIHGTTWFALHQRGQLQRGETVLVLAAAGGVGSSAVQMARAHGCWVAAAAAGERKTKLCEELGADLVIDYDREDLYERVMQATDRRGVDVIYDPVGGQYFDAARRLLAFEGRLLVVGFASGSIPKAPLNHALVKNYSIVGVHMAAYREHRPDLVRHCYEELHRSLLNGSLDVFVSEEIGFEALPETLARLANRDTVGRVVFDPRR